MEDLANAAAQRARYDGQIDSRPVVVKDPQEAILLADGQVFSFNGCDYLKVGPGVAEPL